MECETYENSIASTQLRVTMEAVVPCKNLTFQHTDAFGSEPRIIAEYQVIAALILISVVAWFFWPRYLVRHLPTAPNSCFILGHLPAVCRTSLEKCSLQWRRSKQLQDDDDPPLITYYKGRTPVVLVCCPRLAKEMLRASYQRTYSEFFYRPPLTLNTAQGDTWKQLRRGAMKKLVRAARDMGPFVKQKCLCLEKIFQDCANNKTPSPSEPIELVALMRSLSLDVVAKAVLNIDLNTIEGNHPEILADADWITWYQQTANRSVFVMFFSSLFLIPVEWLLRISSVFAGKTVFSIIETEMQRSQRQNPANHQHDTFNSILKEIAGEHVALCSTYTTLVAALDNTGTALAMVFYFLATNPRVERKLLQELDKAKEGASPVEDCAYLDWCLKETLRLFTLIPFFGRTMERDVVLGSHFVPKGTDCMVAAHILHLDEKHWGADATMFRPERFDPSTKEYQARHTHSYLPFGAGRDCAGRSIVLAQMKAVIAELLPKFEFQVDETSLTPKDFGEMEISTGLARCPTSGIHVRCRNRRQQNLLGS